MVRTQLVPNDPYYLSSGSWGLGFDDLWGLKKISTSAAWDVTTGSGLVVAVVDTGIDYNHPDLAANIWTNAGEIPGNGIDDDGNGFVDDVRGWDFIGTSYSNPIQDNNPMDVYGHGTHVAGTIAAVGNNALGVVGVAFGAKVMAVKGIADNGYGADSSLAAALRYAADHGADVINNSWAGTGTSFAISDALLYAYSLGTVIVSAAGNSNLDVGNYYPANSPYSLAIAATDFGDQKLWFSNWGAKLDVAAPGYDILSVRAANSNLGQLVGTDYMRLSGTSMASPHAAGLAALLLTQHPEYSPEQVRQAIRVSADDLAPAGQDINSGYGRINADRALHLPPVLAAKILSPAPESLLVIGAATITGEASGATFASYVLERGYGESPTSWTMISQGTTPVSNGALGTFDPGHVVDGRYTLRLTVTDTTGQTFRDQVAVVVDKTMISLPPPPTDPSKAVLYRPGLSIEVWGRVIGPAFQSYRVEWSRGSSGQGPWSTSGVTLTNGGAYPTSYGLLATWNTTGIADADFYLIRVLATHTDGFTDDARTLVYLEPDLVNANWPKALTNRPVGPVASALDANGSRRLYVMEPNVRDSFAADGSSVSQFFMPSGPLMRLPATHILDGTPGDKVVVQDGSQLRLIQANNTSSVIAPPMSATFQVGEMPPVILADLDGDGFREILATGQLTGSSGTLSVFAFKQNGQLMSGQYPITLPTQGFVPTGDRNRMLAVDVDGDGRKELVVVSADSGSQETLHLHSADGTRLAWADPIIPGQVSRMIAADVDQDGQIDLVVAYRQYSPTWQDRIVVFSAAGVAKPGWPISVPGLSALYLAVADLKADGTRKIIAAGGYYLNVYNADGSALAGWPRNDPSASFGPIVVGDVTGDGVPEIVVARWNILASVGAPFLPEDGGQAGAAGRVARTIRVATIEDRIKLADGDEVVVLGATAQSGTTNYVDGSVLVLGASNTLLRTWRVQGINGKGVDNYIWPTIGDFDGSGIARVGVTYATTIDLGGGSYMTSGGVLSVYSMNGAFVANRQPWPSMYANARNTMSDPTAETQRSGVIIIAPAGGATVGGNVTITANAVDDRGLAGVQFQVDGQDLAFDPATPFAADWNTRAWSNGSHTLTAIARATGGVNTSSDPVTVTVFNDLPPTVGITSPIAGATVAGTITVTAQASDDIGVAGVQFKLDGANVGAEDAIAPYSFSLDTTTLPNGNHSVVAVARDSGGQLTTSSPLGFAVNNDQPPSVSVTAPAAGATLIGNVTLTASAGDDLGVAGVQFKVDGVSVGVEDTVAPYSITLDSTTLANGAHTITAVARDTGGHLTTSAGVAVTVNNIIVKVNFQKATAPAFPGYLVDGGASFANRGNGYSYGWSSSLTGSAFDRNSSLSPDQRYDTLVEMKNATWEITLPNGTYRVHLVAGDPTKFDSIFRIAAEGVTVIYGAPTTSNRWLEGTVQVVVNDGRLTLTALSGQKNNRVCFIDINNVAP